MRVNRLLSPTELPMIAYRHYFTTMTQSFVRLSCPHDRLPPLNKKRGQSYFSPLVDAPFK